MDIISIEEMNHIYWLGRYSERVYTTIREYFKGRNIMIEQPAFYITYCKNFTIPNCYKSSSDFLHHRDPFKIYGYHFGGNEKTVCIVGSIRGNEIQQLYMCASLVKTLKLLESRGSFDSERGIMVVPSVNPYSLNTNTRFWATDHTDINRMFPGYDLGETTQRIADGFFKKVNDFIYGIHFTSFYLFYLLRG